MPNEDAIAGDIRALAWAFVNYFTSKPLIVWNRRPLTSRAAIGGEAFIPRQGTGSKFAPGYWVGELLQQALQQQPQFA